MLNAKSVQNTVHSEMKCGSEGLPSLKTEAAEFRNTVSFPLSHIIPPLLFEFLDIMVNPHIV